MGIEGRFGIDYRRHVEGCGLNEVQVRHSNEAGSATKNHVRASPAVKTDPKEAHSNPHVELYAQTQSLPHVITIFTVALISFLLRSKAAFLVHGFRRGTSTMRDEPLLSTQSVS